MNASSYFVEEAKNSNMPPIHILNWYRNFYYTENDNTEHGIMVKAIDDIFMRLKDMGLSKDKRLLVSNENYKLKYKNKEQNTKKLHETSNKFDDNIVATNNKLIKLIDLIQTSIYSPNSDVIYDLDLLKNELREENYYIKSEEEHI